MIQIILVFHVLISIALIGLVLIQQGKGSDIGAAFGSGASNTVFGSTGSASFLTRTTAVLATLFFVTSLSLAYFTAQKREPGKVISDQPAQTQPEQPASEVPSIPANAPEGSAAPSGSTGESEVPSVPAPGQ